MARYENKQSVGSLTASADLTGKKGYLVKISGANTVALAGVGETAVGVLGNDPAQNEPAEVLSGVIVPVVAGAAITAGNSVAPMAGGKARVAITDDKIFGIALENSADGREFSCYVAHQTESLTLDGGIVQVGVAATKTITVDRGVALNADGFLVPMNDAGALSFWGMALETVNNSAGLDGAKEAWVRRDGVTELLTSSGLADTDVGKEVWQTTDAVKVTTTPGKLLVGTIDKVLTAATCVVRYKPMPIVGQRLDRRRVIPFTFIGAVGHVSVNAVADLELPRMHIPISGFADAQTAPGGSYFCTISLDDGTKNYDVVITGSATHGENKTAAAVADALKAGFDTDVTMIDDNASGATANVKGQFEIEYL